MPDGLATRSQLPSNRCGRLLEMRRLRCRALVVSSDLDVPPDRAEEDRDGGDGARVCESAEEGQLDARGSRGERQEGADSQFMLVEVTG